MKRITALVMALAMVLTLSACGGKNADQPSNNVPPVTQNQPNNTPDDTQPSEPTNTTPNGSQNNAGALPEAGFYLYDGVHYLSAISDGDNISSTVISGEKAANTVHEVFVELTESVRGATCGSMSIPLGQNEEPFDYQIFFVDESKDEFNGIGKTVTPGGTNSFGLADSFGWVVNSSDEEKAVADCPLVLFTSDVLMLRTNPNGKITLDGQPVAILDDLINVLGTPTAAYCMGGPQETYFIWQFENFIYTAWVQAAEFEEKFDEARQTIYLDVNWNTAEAMGFCYYVPNSGADETTIMHNLWNTTWSVQALTDLGLL